MRNLTSERTISLDQKGNILAKSSDSIRSLGNYLKYYMKCFEIHRLFFIK